MAFTAVSTVRLRPRPRTHTQAPRLCARTLPRPRTPTASASASLGGRSYQLEEMEDSANQTSAIFLDAGGGVRLGTTDGPTPERTEGRWAFREEDGLLTLELERWFELGGASDSTYSVKRILRGHQGTRDGDVPIFEGAMFREPTDYAPEEALGHWALVQSADYDVTEE